MHFAVVMGLKEVSNVLRKRELFRAVTDREFLGVLFNYFEIRTAVTTSMTEAIHLTKAADYAIFLSKRKAIEK